MPPDLETTALTVRAAWSFGTAALSAFGAIASRLLADALPPGTERLIDLGFAGIFIISLLYCVRVLWLSKLDALKKHAELEKEVRDGLLQDLREANKGRIEMIEALKSLRKDE